MTPPPDPVAALCVCTHPESAHYLTEYGDGWPARWEVLREHVETLTDDIAYIDLALDIDDAEWDQMRSHVKAAREAIGARS